MPGATPSSSAIAVVAKYEEVVGKHNKSLPAIEELHEIASNELIPAVLQQVGLEDDAQAESSVRAFLDDRATLFRFLRRSRYNIQDTLNLLSSTLAWRIRSDLDSLSLSSLHPLYVSPPGRPPLFWSNTRCRDKLGRPAGVISLQSLERVTREDGSAGLDECHEYIVGCMESVRRYLSNLYNKQSSASLEIDYDMPGSERRPLQMVIIFSLEASGMANLELELLPFLLDLLKNHFPSMVGAVYIVHYGWVHSGMWALAKRVLPKQALAKIFFPGANDLPDHFDLQKLPSCLGGEWGVTLNDESNNVMRKFARTGLQGSLYSTRSADDDEPESNSAPPSPRGISGTSSPMVGRSSRTLSRAGSFDSLIDEFYSTSNTPWHLTPRASQASTPHAELSQYPFGSHGTATALRMTPTAAKKLQQIQISRGGSGKTRSRANSDADGKAAPAAAAADDVRTVFPNRSPALSGGNSPTRSRRRTLTGSRSVHFKSTSEDDVRRGRLRDFRLSHGDFASKELTGETSGSEESEKSGKVGENTRDPNRAVVSPTGFFSRWRKNSKGSMQPMAGEKVETTAEEEQKGREQDDLEEMEPEPLPSPHLQVPGIEEPPLYNSEALSRTSQLLSRRSKKFGSIPGHVSPYNEANPHYGYPAYPISGTSYDSGRRSVYLSSRQYPERLQFRKRKRDLLRTLIYLFVLRLLSMHRGVRSQLLAASRGLVRAIRVGGSPGEEEGEQQGWKEANERYRRLKSANSRYGKDAQSAPKAKQAQPLIELGFRKRYALLALFLVVILRQDWRSRLFGHCKGILALAGLSKATQLDNGLSHDDDLYSIQHSDSPSLNLDEGVTYGSLTGLHVRRRLGWK